jgi:hypothetical protein
MNFATRLLVRYIIFPAFWLGAQNALPVENQQETENAAVKYLSA